MPSFYYLAHALGGKEEGKKVGCAGVVDHLAH